MALPGGGNLIKLPDHAGSVKDFLNLGVAGNRCPEVQPRPVSNASQIA